MLISENRTCENIIKGEQSCNKNSSKDFVMKKTVESGKGTEHYVQIHDKRFCNCRNCKKSLRLG